MSRIDVDTARRLVGRTLGVDPELWCWAPVDIRWLAAHWRLTLDGDDGRRFRQLTARPPRLVPVVGPLWEVLRRVFHAMPWPLRGLVAFVCLFVYLFECAYLLGRY